MTDTLDICPIRADNENGMFSGTLFELLLQVVKTWQVIVMAVVVILYFYLVGFVSRSYRRPRTVSKSKPQKTKAPKPAKAPKGGSGEPSTNDELGLEES